MPNNRKQWFEFNTLGTRIGNVPVGENQSLPVAAALAKLRRVRNWGTWSTSMSPTFFTRTARMPDKKQLLSDDVL